MSGSNTDVKNKAKITGKDTKIFGKLVASIEADEYNIDQHIDECLQKIEDTWSDVSVDYSSVEEYFLELVDVDSWVRKNWITFSVEFKESE